MIPAKRPRGRPRNHLPKPTKSKIFKNGLAWGLDALNNPEFDLRAKAMILASVLRYEAARDYGAVAAVGKKEKRAAVAKDAASAAYAPPPPPPPPPMSFPERTLSS